MREIKFRGKRIDTGEWVYGHYFTTPLTDENSGAPSEDGWFFLTGEQRHCISTDGVVYVIDHSTLGQYIGNTDDEGQEAYESDILYGSYGIPPVYVQSTIEFENGSFIIKTPGHNPEQATAIEAIENLNARILGNKHDNPELLV